MTISSISAIGRSKRSNSKMNCYRWWTKTPARSAAIESATKYAAEVPLKVMETASKSYALLAEMAEKGNPASISDVGVGALATRACIEGAALNVRINLGQLKDEKFRTGLQDKVRKGSVNSEAQFKTIIQVVEGKLGKS